MPFHPFCSQGQTEQNVANEIQMADGEMSAADSNTSLQGKKSGCTFGQNETLLLISLYQKYKENCSDNGCIVGRHICYAMFTRPGPAGFFLCRQSELFLAFRTNHSYSRIVDKKTRPKVYVFTTFSYLIKNTVGGYRTKVLTLTVTFK